MTLCPVLWRRWAEGGGALRRQLGKNRFLSGGRGDWRLASVGARDLREGLARILSGAFAGPAGWTSQVRVTHKENGLGRT